MNDNEHVSKRKFEIGCPMEETCADVRILNEFFSRLPSKKTAHRYDIGFDWKTRRISCLFVFSHQTKQTKSD